jgi:hypothetical protein
MKLQKVRQNLDEWTPIACLIGTAEGRDFLMHAPTHPQAGPAYIQDFSGFVHQFAMMGPNAPRLLANFQPCADSTRR